MRALTIVPGKAGSAAVTDLPEPPESAGAVLIETVAVGICGTDLELVAGEYGEAPAGEDRLVLGHESLGRVVEAPDASGLEPGQLVVGIVRHPDPVPCPNCAVGEWDMCRNGLYTEHGIKGLHGFASERYRESPEFVVPVSAQLGHLGVLLEPASVVAKAWEHIERIGGRAQWVPESVVVTGAGPIGLLAALLGVQRGLDVHVLDIVDSGAKPELVAAVGATYHSKLLSDLGFQPDVIVECTGVSNVILDALGATAHNGVVCLTGVSAGGRCVQIDAGALNRQIVLENDAIFGSVNANRRHYEQGATALGAADVQWLERLINRRVPLDRFEEALERRPDDVKVVLDVQHS